MAYESLTVKLEGGDVFYFNAGAVLGDSTNRLDLLRDAIDNSSTFRSPDIHGDIREFNGHEVANYFLD
ncbi:hypothetical protein [uncultured Corynebacterium sp.]|uniref:hypothetical protein n=1 Tax=uncultured Corynebacterium sp. TaxID=159447 RepID=UPI0025D0664B|nr:hypothetical protein [uncultured Corynebacterium sp.]